MSRRVREEQLTNAKQIPRKKLERREPEKHVADSARDTTDIHADQVNIIDPEQRMRQKKQGRRNACDGKQSRRR